MNRLANPNQGKKQGNEIQIKVSYLEIERTDGTVLVKNQYHRVGERENFPLMAYIRGGHTMVMMEYHHRTRDLGCSLCADCRGKNCGTPGMCL